MTENTENESGEKTKELEAQEIKSNVDFAAYCGGHGVPQVAMLQNTSLAHLGSTGSHIGGAGLVF